MDKAYQYKDAPVCIYPKARYIEGKSVEEASTTYERNPDYIQRVCFECGRSKRKYWMQFDQFNKTAIELLELSKRKKERLVINFYLRPDRKQMWATLTAFGIYHRVKKGYMIINPDTGEEGFYTIAE